MSPLGGLTDHLDLVAAIEEPAAEPDVPVLLEGYHPPSDPRLRKLEGTPDPGVIEASGCPRAQAEPC